MWELIAKTGIITLTEKEIELVGIDNWNVEAVQHAPFSHGTMPMGFEYEVDPYNNKKSRPQCMKCHSVIIPRARFLHGDTSAHWTEPTCFPCGREPEHCKCEPNTNMDYESICGICGARPTSLIWGIGIMICHECDSLGLKKK